jgi:hypothetical protein
MTSRSDMRIFLIAVFVFGFLGAGAGYHWLSSGSIVIREGSTRVGVGGRLPPPTPVTNAPAAGVIHGDSVLFYPLCFAWIGLGVAMVALAALTFFTASDFFGRLAAYSCVAFLALGFGTVAAALWSGP